MPVRADLLRDFKKGASEGEIRRFEDLRSSTDPAERDRALELFCIGLPVADLPSVGITQTDMSGEKMWYLACTEDHGPSFDAVRQACARAGVEPFGFCDLGICGWYVPRERFFEARRAILKEHVVERSIWFSLTNPRVGPVGTADS